MWQKGKEHKASCPFLCSGLLYIRYVWKTLWKIQLFWQYNA